MSMSNQLSSNIFFIADKENLNVYGITKGDGNSCIENKIFTDF